MTLKEYESIGERVYTHRLDNGLSIYYVQKREYFKTFAFFAANYGGVDRRFKLGDRWIDTPAGVAHYLEHKMFDMPEGNALNMFSQNGASPNAFTSSDMTAYHFKCTDRFYENLELLLKFVSTPYFTQESVDKERGIIGQEVKMGEDNPHRVVFYGLLESLFNHNPIRDEVAGTVESIAEITPEVLYNCHKVFYNPNNMILCVAGDQDPKRIIDTANWVLTAPRGPVPQRDYGGAESVMPDKTKVEINMEMGVPLFMMGAKDRPAADPRELNKRRLVGELTLELLCGKSSPLYAQMYGDGLISRSFSAWYENTAGENFMAISGDSRQPEKVYDTIIDAAVKMADGALDSAAFDRQKKALIGRRLRELDDFEDICYNVAYSRFRGFDSFDAVDTIKTITEDDVSAFAANAFKADRFALSVVR